MSFSCVSASILDTDGYDNFHTANALNTEYVENTMDMYITAHTNCVQTKTWVASDTKALSIGICSDFKTHLSWQHASSLYSIYIYIYIYSFSFLTMF